MDFTLFWLITLFFIVLFVAFEEVRKSSDAEA